MTALTINVNGVLQVAIARLREFFREPVAIFWVYGFPQVILLTLGFTFTDRAPEVLHVDLVGGQGTAGHVAHLHNRLEANGRLVPQITSKPEGLQRLRQVRSSAVVVIQASRKELQGQPTYELHYDPDRVDSMQARALLESVLLRSLLSQARPEADWASSRIVIRERQAIGGRYVDFLVPGLLAVGVMGGSLVGVGYTLVEMRMRRLLRVYLATPLSTGELFAGLMVARLAFLVAEVLFVLIVAGVVFGVGVVGSGWLLLASLLLGTITFLAVGLLIGARGRTLEAASGWVSVLMLVQWVLCGVFFNRGIFPEHWQPLLKLLPLTALVDATRGVMLQGDTLVDLWDEWLILLGWTVAVLPAALWRFRWD